MFDNDKPWRYMNGYEKIGVFVTGAAFFLLIVLAMFAIILLPY